MESYVIFYKTKELENKRRYYAEFFKDIEFALKRKEELQHTKDIIYVSLKEGRL